MTNERSNEEIVQAVIDGKLGDDCPDYWPVTERWAETVVAALAAAGRLVTPEHNAWVRARQTAIVTGYIDEGGWNDLTRAEALREIERRLAQAEKGGTP